MGNNDTYVSTMNDELKSHKARLKELKSKTQTSAQKAAVVDEERRITEMSVQYNKVRERKGLKPVAI